jgi:hypothetical protein
MKFFFFCSFCFVKLIAEIRQLETRIQMTQEKHSNEIKTVYWVIGIAMAVILFVVARK